ncbi:MAG: N-acyl homoserine lactonase family protein [Gemmatimonadaceae bacterium]
MIRISSLDAIARRSALVASALAVFVVAAPMHAQRGAKTIAADSRVPNKVSTYEVYAIQYATIPNFKMSGLIAGADTSRRLDLAMMVWLIKGPNGKNILVDAGFQRQDLVNRWKPTNFELPSAAVAHAGVKAEDITDIIISHIHWDHFDGAELFPNAKIWLQRDEYEHYVDSTGKQLDRAIDAPDAAMLHRLFVAGRVKLVEGDKQEIFPGITVYIGGKHTFQSQYAGVHTAEGTVVLASDNAYLYENFETHRPIAQTLDSASNMAAQRRMLEIASKPSLIVPGHDPQVMTRFTKVAPGVVRIR